MVLFVLNSLLGVVVAVLGFGINKFSRDLEKHEVALQSLAITVAKTSITLEYLEKLKAELIVRLDLMAVDMKHMASRRDLEAHVIDPMAHSKHRRRDDPSGHDED